MAFDKDNKVTALRVKTYANLGAYMSLFSSSVPTYLYATLLSGQYNIPNIFAEVISVYTNTTPVDAYRGAGRPEASFVVERLMETAARQLKVDPAELRRKNFITTFPHQTPVIMAYDVGDFGASLDAALKAIDYNGFPARKEKARKEGKLRGIGFSCYIEACVAPRKRSAASAPASAYGNPPRSGVNPVGTIEILTVRTATVGAMRRHSPNWSPIVSAFRSARSRSSTETPTRCSSAWAPTARARPRSACPRSSRRWRRSRPRPRKSPRISSRRPRTTSSSRTASSRSPAPTSRLHCRWSRSPPTPRTTCLTAWSPA
jgi:hypothetical protein